MADRIVLNKKLRVRRFSVKRKGLIIFSFVSFISLAILLVGGFFLILLPAQKVYGSVQALQQVYLNLRQDLDSQDLSHLDQYIADINQELAEMEKEFQKFEFMNDLGFTRGYYQNLDKVKQISLKSGKLLETSLPRLKILLSSLGYKVEKDEEVRDGGESETPKKKKGEEKFEAFIKELPQIIEFYEEIEPEVIEILEIFQEIDPQYIPSLGSSSFRISLEKMQKLATEFPSVSAQLKSTLSKMPELLGSEKPVNYLLVFQNEKELRSSGGILSAYGIVTIDKGEVVGDIKVTDMWDLEGYLAWTLGVTPGYVNIYGQNVLMNNGCGGTHLRAQDSGIYPDLNVTMDMFKDYYDIARKYNPKKYPRYDHVVTINTFFASDLVALVEPIRIKGYKANINQNNLAKIIFAETSSAPFDPSIRKKFIGLVATEVKNKLIKKSASDFPEVFKTFISTVQAKNIALYSKNKEMQAYFDELGMSGRIEHNFPGDYFHLNEAQNCALKSNFYVKDVVTQKITIRKNGTIAKDVRINWENKKINDPNERFILPTKAKNFYRAWVRIMAPRGTRYTKSDGLLRSVIIGYYPQVYFDKVVKKQISDNIIWFDQRRLSKYDPIKKQELNVSYVLPNSIKYTDEKGYQMLLQKHPGKANELYRINIVHNGKTTSTQFRLDRDKVLTYKQGVITLSNFDTRLDQYYTLLENLADIAN